MGLPAAGVLGDSGVLEPAFQTAIEDLLKFVRQQIGGAVPLDVTLDSSGKFTVGASNGSYLVDGFGAAADDLTNILTTNTQDGQVIAIRAKDSARPITIKNAAGGAGAVATATGEDITLFDTLHWVVLQRSGTDWIEIHRSMWWTLTERVEISTAGSGAPKVLTKADHGKIWSNEGAAAQVYFTLPAASRSGVRLRFWVDDADGIRITTAGTDQIRKGASVSTASTGYIHTTTQGIFIELLCVKSGLWAVSYESGGTFTFV